MSHKFAVAVALSIMGIVITASTAIALNLGILHFTAPTPQVAAASAADSAEPTAAAPAGPPVTVEVIDVYLDDTNVDAAIDDTQAGSPGAPPTSAGPVGPGQVASTTAGTTTAPLPGNASPAPVPTLGLPVTTTYPMYSAGAAGEVALMFDGSAIHFWGAYPNDGWSYEVEGDGPREIEVKFRQGGGDDDESEGEVEFHAQLEGGVIRVKAGVD